MTSNKRMRGIAVHRPLLIGSTATPLTAAEKLSADPIHTHKWTIAVRSAASNPLPTYVLDDTAQANPPPSTSAAGAAVGTRGRESETDYHKHVGGKDDVSHFIRRVQFKLHDSFPQPVRTLDRPPFQVTETGWGEFEVGVKIFWASESGEKPLQTFHYLKLHPWHPLPPVASAAPVENVAEAAASVAEADASKAHAATEATEQASAGATKAEDMTEVATQKESVAAGDADETMTGEASADDSTMTEPPPEAAPVPPPAPALPPVVHSWQYDEVVFPEPTETFYQTLISHPPTPLPTSASQAFTDVKTSRLQSGFNASSSPARDAAPASSNDIRRSSTHSHPATAAATAGDGPPSSSSTPPYPLHNPSSQPYVHGISQASMQAEADRLDIARIAAVRELEKERNRLIDAERELRRVKDRADTLLRNAMVAQGGAVTAQAGGTRA